MYIITSEAIERQEIAVSIIIPAHNAADHIVECIEAILRSEYKNYEILVVDDCSSDGTAELIRTLPCSIFRTKERSGPAGARNLGVQNAKGNMLLLIDADIVIKPHTIGQLLRAFLRKSSIAAVCGIYDRGLKYRNISSLYQRSYNEYKRVFLPSFGPYLSTAICCIPRALMEEVGGFHPHIYTSEDYDLGIRLTSHGRVNFFDRSIEVTHNKHVSFAELIRQKFQYAANMMMLKLNLPDRREGGKLDVKQTFSIAMDQIAAVLLSWPLLIAGILAMIFRSTVLAWTALAFFAIFCIANMRYWIFLFKCDGAIAILFLPISFFEQLVSLLASLSGYIRTRLNLPYWKYRGMP